MGSFRNKAVLLIICFSLAAFLLHRSPEAAGRSADVPLSLAMARIPGWQLVRISPLDRQTRESLELDDYLFVTFSDGREQVSLYIGLYLSARKIGAAHHPLVCFTGQGWEISERKWENLPLEGEETISWATMQASRDLESEFVAYWFQAHDRALPTPFLQKINLLRQKFLTEHEDSAFIRINFPMRGRQAEDCRRIAVDFVNAFYPVYLDYIRKEL